MSLSVSVSLSLSLCLRLCLSPSLSLSHCLSVSVSVSVSVSLSLQNEMLAQQERLDVQTWFFKSNQKNREILTRSKVLPEGGEKSFMSAVMTAQVR